MANEAEVKDEVSIGELSSQDFKEARKNGLETVPKPEPKVEEEREEKPKEKGGFQVRIARLVKENARLADQLEAEKSRKAAGGTEKEKEVAVEPKGRPQKADFVGKEDEYIEALVDWTAEQKIAKAEESKARAAYQAEQQEIADSYNRRVAEVKSIHEDFVEVVGQDVTIPKGVERAIIEEMPNGPEVAYFLGSNPELCEELMKMKPFKAIAEAWKISEKLGESDSGEEEETEEEKPTAKAKAEEKPARKAPEPIRPVGNGKTRSSIPLQEMSMADYKKARAAGRIS
jgi:hypothetical protein